MKSFTLYEFSGILIPGVISLFGISLIFSELEKIFLKDISFGEFGLFILLAYATGHLIQAIGNILESVWWKMNQGMPTDWVRSGKEGILSPEQIVVLEKEIFNKLGIELKSGLIGVSSNHWRGITRQIHAYVFDKSKTERIEIFNAYYGLNRGISASLLLLTILILVFDSYKIATLTLVMSLIAFYRMHRFGKHYARELFVQFLQN